MMCWVFDELEERTMRVLLIGAGAVGQVYGWHFQRGGAEVAFYVREKYKEEVQKGFDIYPMNRSNPRGAPVHFDGFSVYTEMREVAQASFDIVVICLSSTALYKGSWLDELAEGLGDATLVNLTPGMKDYEYITTKVPPAQVVSGMIGLSSYPGPLEGESLPKPGMVYWVPPLTKMTFSGPNDRTRAVVKLLNKGGLKSGKIADVHVAMAFGSPLLQYLMVALELVDWTFAALRRDKALMTLAHKATRQAWGIVGKRMKASTPFGMRLLRPWMLRLATHLIPLVAPIDMERFFKKHFLKVGDQTEQQMQTFLDEAKEQQSPSDAIETLLQKLRNHRSP